MKKKDIIILLIALLSIGGVILFINLSNKKEDKTDETKPETTNLLSGKYNVEIKVKKYGTIKVELDADEAPITVTNFINLVNNYYVFSCKNTKKVNAFTKIVKYFTFNLKILEILMMTN